MAAVAAGVVTYLAPHGGERSMTPPATTRHGLSFGISGVGRGLLSPGGASVPLELVFTNPNARPITVTAVSIEVARTSAPGCDPADVVVARQLRASPRIAGGTTASLSRLGIPRTAWPQLRLRENGAQNGCQGATIHLAFGGKARG